MFPPYRLLSPLAELDILNESGISQSLVINRGRLIENILIGRQI